MQLNRFNSEKTNEGSNGGVYGDLPPAAATTTAARVLGQKLEEREREEKKRFFCKGLRDNFVILNFEFPNKIRKVIIILYNQLKLIISICALA